MPPRAVMQWVSFSKHPPAPRPPGPELRQGRADENIDELGFGAEEEGNRGPVAVDAKLAGDSKASQPRLPKRRRETDQLPGRRATGAGSNA